MSKLEVGKTYKDGDADDVEIVYHDTKRNRYIGWDHEGNVHHSYEEDGRCVNEHGIYNLIIPPQLPWPWVVGDWYLRGDGVAVECTSCDQFYALFGGNSPVASVLTGKCSGVRDEWAIIAHLGPLPQGVYHTSDGDTQLLQDLKRWQERGGKVEAKFTEGHDSWDVQERTDFVADHVLYRAHGYTGDREFPKPPLQMRAGLCRTRDGEIVQVRPSGYREYPWEYLRANGSHYLIYSDGCWQEDGEKTRHDIVELLDDPQPEAKPDPMKRPMTFADYANICALRGFEKGDKIYRDICEAAESQP